MLTVDRDLDTEDGYLPTEALCLFHRVTFNRHLPVCPDCKAGF